MVEDLGRLLNIVLAVVAVATLGGFGYVRGRIGDLRDQLKDAREEIADKDRRLTTVSAEAKQLRTDLDALGRVVTGETHWVAIGDKLDDHHEKAEQHWTRDENVLREIRDRLPAPPNQGGH